MIESHHSSQEKQESVVNTNTLFTFQEAMRYLRVSRSTLYRLMWSGQLTGHKVGSTWRFYQADLQASIRVALTTKMRSSDEPGKDLQDHYSP